MRRGEFQIIDRFFTHDAFGEWRSQGVGDDCAIIDMPGNRIAVTTDMMAVGTHFLPGARPEDIGYKALAVNLSDLAAAGASPRAFFLSIGLPERDDEWLAGFSRGLMALAESSGCALLGGDTTRTAEVGGTHAPVTISITAMGSLPEGKGLTRAGAKPGDDIWVSGTVGDAYAALKHRWGHWQLMPDAAEALFPRMDRPTPRNMLGSALLDLATACADVSDGLLADLDIKDGEKIMLILNGTGATTLMELFIVYRKCVSYLKEKNIEIVANYVGELLTVQEQAGFQMFMARMDDELLHYWNAPCNTPYMKK